MRPEVERFIIQSVRRSGKWVEICIEDPPDYLDQGIGWHVSSKAYMLEDAIFAAGLTEHVENHGVEGLGFERGAPNYEISRVFLPPASNPGTLFSFGSDVFPGLAKLLEEMGELGQVCGKLMGTGGQVEHWDGTNLRDRLEEELGDLEAAILFFGLANPDIDLMKVMARSQKKLELFKAWHAEGEKSRLGE